MKKKKYFTEHGINMTSGWMLLLQQSHLSDVDEIAKETGKSFHIYMICRRPRISAKPSTVKFDSGYMSGEFKVDHGGRVEERKFKIPNNTGKNNITFESSYPHTEFEVLDESGDFVSGGKFSHLLLFDSRHRDLLDLEVLYVGQAFGKEGERNAADRLKSHSKLQEIYSEAMNRAPNQEIWLVISEFEPLLVTLFDPRADQYETSEEEDKEHTREVLHNRVSERHSINFTEAALIKYFQPKYNAVFKDTFPDKSHESYEECYDLDLNGVCVEVNTEQLRCRLWSESAEKSWIHFARYPLHTRAERKSIFHIDWDDDDT